VNWDAVGAIGEIVGAAAVLSTLVYLALQTRQARVAAEETAKYSGLQATHSIVDLYVDARRMLIEHRELIARANEGQVLSESDRLALSLVFHDLFYAAAYSHLSSTSAGSVHAEGADVDYFASLLSENPAAIAEWHRHKHLVAKMSTEFVALVDETLAASSERQPSRNC
jgi:hypothetical protein